MTFIISFLQLFFFLNPSCLLYGEKVVVRLLLLFVLSLPPPRCLQTCFPLGAQRLFPGEEKGVLRNLYGLFLSSLRQLACDLLLGQSFRACLFPRAAGEQSRGLHLLASAGSGSELARSLPGQGRA